MSDLRLLAYTDSPAVGGAELALGYLIGALGSHVRVGVLATDASVAEAIAAHRPGTVTLTVRHPRGPSDPAALYEHFRAVRSFSPHVLHANQAWPWACAYGELAGLLTRGTRVLAVDHLPVASAVTRLRRIGRRSLARRLHAHVAVGERAARLVEDIVGLAHESVGSIPNGVPVEPTRVGNPDDEPTTGERPSGEPAADERVTDAQATDAPGGADRQTVVGSLGRLTEQKGYDLLVKVLPELPSVKLVLVGDGPQRGSLEALASQLGVADRLTITGWRSDARAHLAELDVFALPSRWEGMPLGILEAMHAGLPVLAADVGSVPEVVQDGHTGFLTPPEDTNRIRECLARMSTDRELRTRMGAQGRLVARERFTDTVMASRYEALYSDMVNSRPVPPGSSKSAR